MFEIRKYNNADKEVWNAYVEHARNATFLFNRNYMDYHSDRFKDYSLMFYKNGKLHSLLPAHEREDIFCSHFGLTYGGLIMNKDVTAADVVQLFKELNEHLRLHGFKKVLYKPVPWVYHQMPSEEDLYAIYWVCKARIVKRDIGSVLFLQEKPRWRRLRRRSLKKAQEAGIIVKRENNFEGFWKVLDANLEERYQVHPVHTLQEIELLHSRFPDNIIQYNAYLEDEIIAGFTFYITPQTVHGQYCSSNDKGKELGGIDAIYDQVLNHDYADYKFFDFGRSTEGDGDYLNEGLISQKEGFGGRGVVYDTYEWKV